MILRIVMFIVLAFGLVGLALNVVNWWFNRR